MKITKEQEQRALNEMRPLGKIFWKIGVIKVADVKVQKCDYENYVTTQIVYNNRMWHPVFIIATLLVTLVSIFMTGVPEAYRDMKELLENKGETIEFYD